MIFCQITYCTATCTRARTHAHTLHRGVVKGESPVINASTGWQYQSESSLCMCVRSRVCVILRGSSFFRHSGVSPAARHRLQRRPGEVEPARLFSLQGVSSPSNLQSPPPPPTPPPQHQHHTPLSKKQKQNRNKFGIQACHNSC